MCIITYKQLLLILFFYSAYIGLVGIGNKRVSREDKSRKIALGSKVENQRGVENEH